MAKNSVADWDTTAANNTDVGGIDLQENIMRPPAVNNAFREVMAQIRAGVPIKVSTTTDNAIVRFNGTSGQMQNTGLLIDDSNNLSPSANDGGRLGQPTLGFSDLFLASGGVVGWNNFDVTIAHSADNLFFQGAASGYVFDAPVAPSASDGAALGSGTLPWSDLYLASGGIIGWNNGQVTLTHSGAVVTINTQFQAGTYSSSGASAGMLLVGDNGSGSSNVRTSTTLTSAEAHAQFANPNGVVGTITTSGTATSYNTTSDGRLKPEREAFDPGPIIEALTPIRHNWVNAPDVWSYGFIAQDVHAVFPAAVSVGKGEFGEDDFVPWSMDLSKLVPILFMEIKNLRMRVAALEGKN